MMRKPRVAVASLGGTITMTSDAGDGAGVRPTLGIDELLAAVPALEAVAELKAETLATLPGASLQFSDVLGAMDWARSAVADGADGVVVVQGTDTLEETAYLLDLHWDRPEPIVVTGAMRAPRITGTDGPANVLAAVLTAAVRQSRDLGVLVAMNDVVHAAVRVRKMHSTAVDAFHSPGFGPLGHVHEGRVTYGNQPVRWPALPRPTQASPRVALLETCLGDDGGMLELVVDAGYDGVVLAAFGAGHVPAGLALAVSRVTPRCPVVLASRTGGGTTLRRTYGFVGSERDLVERGAVPAGWLDPRKARVLLWSLLASGRSVDDIREHIPHRGEQPGGPMVAGG
jgi:L-asparaginase